MSPTFQALTVRNYRLYWTGGVVSNTGTWLQRLAQDWLVLQLTHVSSSSGTSLGITTGLQFLPFLLLTPIAGMVADRYPKRRLLLITQSWLAVSAGLLGVLALSGHAQVWEVYLLALLFGVGTSFDTPTRQSFVVEMVGRDMLTNAVGLNSASFNMGRIVGPGMAGLLIAALGGGARAAGVVILLNAISYLAVIGSLQAMRVRDLNLVEPVPRAKGAVREGLRYVLERPELVFVFVVAFFAGTFGMNFQMTSALMATQVFHKGAGAYGVLGSAMAVGSLAGALLAARRPYPRRLLLVLSALSFAIAEIVAGVMPSYLSFAVFLPVLGICSLTMLNSLQMVVQISVSPELRGRVLSLYMMLLMGGTPFGSPLIGWVGSTFGARWMLIGGGAVTGVAVLAATFWLIRTERIDPRGVSLLRERVAV